MTLTCTVSPQLFEDAVADGKREPLETRVARLRGELDSAIAPLLARAREPAPTDTGWRVLLRAWPPATAAPDGALIERLVALNSAVAADTTIPRRSEVCNRLHVLIGNLVLLTETTKGSAAGGAKSGGPASSPRRRDGAAPSSPAITLRRPPPSPPRPQEPRSPGYDLL